MEPVVATTELTHPERPFEPADLDNKSKGALQDFVMPQRNRWPAETMGKFTQKTNMSKMRTVLLDRGFGFTTRAPPLRPLPDTPNARASECNSEGSSELSAADASVDIGLPLVSGGDASCLGNHQPNNSSPVDTTLYPSYSAPQAPGRTEPLLDMDTEPVEAAKHEQPQSFGFPSTFGVTDLQVDGTELFRTPEMAEMSMPGVFGDPNLFNPSSLSLSVQEDAGTRWIGPDAKPFKKHRGPAKQASFARAKNDPERIRARQQAKNQTVEWLLAELESRPGYQEFRDAFHTTQHNQGAVRSWTFVVEFKEAYNKLRLVNGRYKKIKVCDIKTALTIGGAWLCDAEKAVNIIRTFGEGGAHSSAEFIAKVTSTEEKEGSTKLLAWLKNWARAHSM